MMRVYTLLMRSRAGQVAALYAVLSGCAAHEPPPAHAPRSLVAARHRPRWVQTVAADVDAMVRCLEGREGPAYVLYVHHTVDRLTAMTTTDAYGALEHCVVGDGTVFVRKPALEHLTDFSELPLFSLGGTPPAVPPMTVLEEIVSEGTVIGWVHWPLRDEPAADDDDDAQVAQGKREER